MSRLTVVQRNRIGGNDSHSFICSIGWKQKPKKAKETRRQLSHTKAKIHQHMQTYYKYTYMYIWMVISTSWLHVTLLHMNISQMNTLHVKRSDWVCWMYSHQHIKIEKEKDIHNNNTHKRIDVRHHANGESVYKHTTTGAGNRSRPWNESYAYLRSQVNAGMKSRSKHLSSFFFSSFITPTLAHSFLPISPIIFSYVFIACISRWFASCTLPVCTRLLYFLYSFDTFLFRIFVAWAFACSLRFVLLPTIFCRALYKFSPQFFFSNSFSL